MANGSGTSGGWRGMNGTQRKLALALAAAFLVIMAVIMLANAESSLSDQRASGYFLRTDLVWSWEWTSMIAWFTVFPVIWLAVKWIRPPRVPWIVTGIALVVGSIVASGGHVLLMVGLRHLYYAATGAGTYQFFDGIENKPLYEYRKDVGSYLQFVAIFTLAQWLIARAATAPVAGPTMLAVNDGAVTHLIPVDEIESVAAAGNYVEIAWRGRTLLHRATLAAVEAELGQPFLRIHRGRLVRRAAIRRIETDKSGDFTVELASGATLRGSRRYRPAD
ncbi:LytTR family DNA-binding domain-containing protein [Sphingomonas bacterium]|uniref:LytTR family DNA-binding domain-containing protein n=1 Tax=Sphingomonas bacterium TaxID=1895847 RepID=UPI00262681C1|nr:LytTR family DNA-binding domain-containing protein [Sphingomonas bacterium]MDB5677123.1 LytTR family transcriptional regulator [Sphingomonas bacterium]